MLTICYRTKKPVIYNAGTKYEKRCSDFLDHYVYGNMAQAERELAELSATKPASIDHYYIKEQEQMGK